METIHPPPQQPGLVGRRFEVYTVGEMAIRKDKHGHGHGHGQTLRGSKIAIAIAVGISVGCVFAFLYPNGLFFSASSSDPPPRNRPLAKLSSQVSKLASYLENALFIKAFRVQLKDLRV